MSSPNPLFGDSVVRDITRGSLHTVINATELRTGSAFRFGSKQSGCWRFGTIAPEDALVADAVAASAAYPVLLPALDRKYRFTKSGGHHWSHARPAHRRWSLREPRRKPNGAQ